MRVVIEMRALEQAERLAVVGRLAAGVVDRLNHPLTRIVMTASLLEKEVGRDSPLWADVQRITVDASRCSHLIHELRVFASPRSRHNVLSSVSVVVDQALALTARELAACGVRIERDLAADVPEVDWDADQISQVLVSLFMNAAQAMPDGGTLRVRARHAGEWLAIEIRDTGSGIPPEHRPTSRR